MEFDTASTLYHMGQDDMSTYWRHDFLMKMFIGVNFLYLERYQYLEWHQDVENFRQKHFTSKNYLWCLKQSPNVSRTQINERKCWNSERGMNQNLHNLKFLIISKLLITNHSISLMCMKITRYIVHNNFDVGTQVLGVKPWNPF